MQCSRLTTFFHDVCIVTQKKKSLCGGAKRKWHRNVWLLFLWIMDHGTKESELLCLFLVYLPSCDGPSCCSPCLWSLVCDSTGGWSQGRQIQQKSPRRQCQIFGNGAGLLVAPRSASFEGLGRPFGSTTRRCEPLLNAIRKAHVFLRLFPLCAQKMFGVLSTLVLGWKLSTLPSCMPMTAIRIWFHMPLFIFLSGSFVRPFTVQLLMKTFVTLVMPLMFSERKFCQCCFVRVQRERLGCFGGGWSTWFVWLFFSLLDNAGPADGKVHKMGAVSSVNARWGSSFSSCGLCPESWQKSMAW